MSDSTGHHARREGALQTAVFIGALAVLIAVLYASFTVQSGRRQEAQRQETAVAATAAALARTPTIPRLIEPPMGANTNDYPAPAGRPTPAPYPEPDAADSRHAPDVSAYPTPTGSAP